MGIAQGSLRPPVHILETESDIVTALALKAEHQYPVIAAMLFDEIDRAQLHESRTMPFDAVTLGSRVSYVDERTDRLRSVQLVLPFEANITENRISILTSMGAALFGLRSGDSIDWPDLGGRLRRIRIVKVVQPDRRSTKQDYQVPE